MNPRWIFPGLVLLLAMWGCSRNTRGAESEGKLFVSGRIDGDTVDISSKRDGKIVEITVREGATVEAGKDYVDVVYNGMNHMRLSIQGVR